MKNLDLSHHAYVVAGPRDSIVSSLLNVFESKFQIKTVNNQDCRVIHFESIGIDESRELKELQNSRPVVGDRKILVVSTNAVTVQAQNAMLKMFEEPAESTLFFIIVPSLSFFIDTLLSRVVTLESHSASLGAVELHPKKFLEATYPERLKMVEKFLKAYKDSKENKSMAHTFLCGVEGLLAVDVKKNMDAIQKLLELKKYVFDTSASLKMILETSALVFPYVK